VPREAPGDQPLAPDGRVARLEGRGEGGQNYPSGYYSLWWGSIALAKRMTLGGNSTTEEEAAVLRDTFLNTNPELIYFKKRTTLNIRV